MTQLSMFYDELEEKLDDWCRIIATHKEWEREIDCIFDGFSGESSSRWCYEIRHGLMMYADKLFNWYNPEPYVRKITKKEFKERVKEWL